MYTHGSWFSLEVTPLGVQTEKKKGKEGGHGLRAENLKKKKKNKKEKVGFVSDGESSFRMPSGGHDAPIVLTPYSLLASSSSPRPEKKRGKLFDRTASFFKASLGIINGGEEEEPSFIFFSPPPSLSFFNRVSFFFFFVKEGKMGWGGFIEEPIGKAGEKTNNHFRCSTLSARVLFPSSPPFFFLF